MNRVESAEPRTKLDAASSDARVAALEAQLKEAAVEIAELRARGVFDKDRVDTVLDPGISLSNADYGIREG